jgi:hypothetical protein
VNKIKIKEFAKRTIKEYAIYIVSVLLLIYLLISLYFVNHFYFNTIINGVDVSLKAHKDLDLLIENYLLDYKLQLIERNGITEDVSAIEIGIQHNDTIPATDIYRDQFSLKWVVSLFHHHKYYVKDLYNFDKSKLVTKIEGLDCLNKNIVEPQNVSFQYENDSYVVIKEIYGNKVNYERLHQLISLFLLQGKRELNLDKEHCYVNPKYTLNSRKTIKTTKLLDKYTRTKITYLFGNQVEKLDGSIINKWIIVNKNLNITIDKIAIKKYIKELSKKYDTVGITREFKTSTGKMVKVKGGLYGWKIDQDMEVKAILLNIRKGEIITKEPIYLQEAVSREGNEIGNTYVEINITRQHLWFYKDGKLIVQGPVVTGNPNRGNATVVGAYMLNYKQKEAVLSGQNYEAKVTYWMPFYGNIGIHDATWRQRFGGEIYKSRGTHGCVNAPVYLARILFEHIEEGMPIICYEE